MHKNIIDSSFFARDTVTVAQELLGKTIVRYCNGTYLSGVINETEAYRGSGDPASHAYRGKTKRNAAMFGPVGHAYVYFTYGMHFCLNIVAHSNKQSCGGVLIRGLIPQQGRVQMQINRGRKEHLTDGPGKLAQALHITKEQYGINMTQEGPLYIVDEGIEIKKEGIICTPRIGISVAQDRLWRFYVPRFDAR